MTDHGYRVTIPSGESDWRDARRLVEDYGASLGVDLSFQDFAAECANLPALYRPPSGAFLLVRATDGAAVACVGLKAFASRVAEMKRLYVMPDHRQHGLGVILVNGIVERARALGYRQIRLDTLAAMNTAQALYQRCGFRDIEAYRHNPLPGTRYMALDLMP